MWMIQYSYIYLYLFLYYNIYAVVKCRRMSTGGFGAHRTGPAWRCGRPPCAIYIYIYIYHVLPFATGQQAIERSAVSGQRFLFVWLVCLKNGFELGRSFSLLRVRVRFVHEEAQRRGVSVGVACGVNISSRQQLSEEEYLYYITYYILYIIYLKRFNSIEYLSSAVWSLAWQFRSRTSRAARNRSILGDNRPY